MKKTALQTSFATAVIVLLFVSTAQAAFIVHSPHVEKGIFEIESKNSLKYDDHADEERQHKVELKYGLTTWWALALEGELEKEGSEGYDYTATEIESYFQFTDPGEYWLDAGALLAYEFKHNSGSADKVEAHLHLQKNLTQSSHTANIMVEQEVGDNANHNPEWEFAWQSIYLYKPMLNPGFEYYAEFNEVGNSGNFDDQSHYLGPVLTGTLYRGVKYDLGWLFGLSNGSADGVVKFNIEYEFPL